MVRRVCYIHGLARFKCQCYVNGVFLQWQQLIENQAPLKMISVTE
jgi:hypothetical protein